MPSAAKTKSKKMPLEQTITIVNNSGKIISTGKHLLSVFKEAKGAYADKKAQLKSEKSGLSRARTFDQPSSRSVYQHQLHNYDEYYEEEDDYYYKYNDEQHTVYDDEQSETASRRTGRSKSTISKYTVNTREQRMAARPRAALTESNLKTLSEVSSTAPSKAPSNYRSPYVETAPRDMVLSRPDLANVDARSLAVTERRPPTTAMTRRQSQMEVGGPRRHSYDYGSERGHQRPASKEIDMHLAYGDMPPDLADRVDLDPVHKEVNKEEQAQALVRKVEGILDEAHCIQHSASHTIAHLQQNPEAAAAVALTLAELSTIVSKMSPTFLGLMKGGSPAVFALLASPQFLIGTAAVVGVTVVMFGGWKIVKKVKEAQAQALAFEGMGQARAPSEYGMDEAYVVDVDEELSTIESWRRGIVPEFGENETAEIELITPEADRATGNRYSKYKEKDADYDDLRSRRSAKTTKTTKSKKKDDKSSKQAESVAGSERSKKTKTKKEKKPLLALEAGRSGRADDDFDKVFRPKAQRQGSNMLKALFKNKDKEREMVRV